MKITVLVENNSKIDRYLLSEPAFSLLIENENKRILFDTGYSDVFLKNADVMKINLEDITDIVLSHGHNDHTGGLRFFSPKNKNIKFTAHPNIFDKKYEPDGTLYSCPVSKEEIEDKYILNLTKEKYYLSDRLLFLGEIDGNRSSDIDDTALAYIKGKEIFIITGCSHSGIINIVEQAKKVTGINRVYGVLGGFHLLEADSEAQKIGEYFKKEEIEYIAPCHCCDLMSKIILSKNNKIKEICTGDVIYI